MQKIVPFLWFDGNAEEAMNFYVSVFKNSKVLSVTRYGEAGPGPKGTVMSCTFQLEGQDFYALNGGPQFKFTPAISLFVNCETQQEIDALWKTLSAGGSSATPITTPSTRPSRNPRCRVQSAWARIRSVSSPHSTAYAPAARSARNASSARDPTCSARR